MYKGTGCDSKQTFPDGITNGYSWYQLEGKNVHVTFSATSDSLLLLPHLMIRTLQGSIGVASEKAVSQPQQGLSEQDTG